MEKNIQLMIFSGMFFGLGMLFGILLGIIIDFPKEIIIDYGDNMVVVSENLKNLSDTIKQCPDCICKITDESCDGWCMTDSFYNDSVKCLNEHPEIWINKIR